MRPASIYISFFTSLIIILTARAKAAEEFSLETEKHVEKAAGEGTGLPQFNPETFPSQIFWLAIAFIIMYLAFSRRILPDIARTLENREQHINSDLEAAKKLTDEAEDVHKNYDEKLANARHEASQILANRDELMKKKADEMHREFAKDADKQISKTKQRLDDELHKALQEIDSQISDISIIAAEKTAGIEADPKEVKSVIQSLSKPETKAA
jgi:F-type H+-transporting ATPase subunit b